MYHLLGFGLNVRNLLHLGMQADPNHKFATLPDVATAFRAYLAKHQPASSLGPALPGKGPAIQGGSARSSLRMEHALATLALIAPELSSLLATVITVVVLRPGAPPGALGVVRATPSDAWTDVDFQEVLVRELARTLLVVDERCREPLEPALKELILATELLLFRERHGLHDAPRLLHPPSPALLASARGSAETLKPPGDRSLQLLERCRRALVGVQGAAPWSRGVSGNSEEPLGKPPPAARR